MLKLAGALILMAGASSIGFGAAAQLRARVTSLRALIGGLELMERELSFRLTPMPDLLAVVAKRAQAPACYFFARCRDSLDRLGEKSLGELWREALDAEPDLLLSGEETLVLAGRGEVLGRYDGDGQREALESALAELARCLKRAEEDRNRLGRMYGVLGMGAGALTVILLL